MRTAALLLLLFFVGCSHESSLSESAITKGRAMDWIHVEKGTPQQIMNAILSHAAVTVPEKPRTFTISLSSLESGGHSVQFDAKVPPYAFANLISWLSAPPRIEDVSIAIGWYTSPSTNCRYFLRPDENNSMEDSLVGASKDGDSISVYLPDLSVCPISSRVIYVGDGDLLRENRNLVLSFEVTLDVDESFGNPKFQLTHEKDFRW